MSKPAVRYLVFDIESVADGELVSKIRYPGQGLSAADAVRRYRDELMAKYETRFHSLHVSGAGVGRRGQGRGRFQPDRHRGAR